MKNRRIFITGASGTGKTTLAKYISQLTGLPLVNTSASMLWDKYGFTSHKDALTKCLADLELGYRYQQDIWLSRKHTFLNTPLFVSDRSPIDAYAYFLLQQGYNSNGDNFEFLQETLQQFSTICDVTIFIRFTKDIVLEDNGRRIINRPYQRLVDSAIDMVINKEFYPHNLTKRIYTIDVWDWEKRVARVNEWLKDFINNE